MTLRDLYTVTKPGIIYGNLFTAAGAFLLASHWHFNWFLFLATLLGLGLIIASGSVANNYYDRDIDAVMARTRSRASVTGALSPHLLLIYASVLGLLGSAVLYFFANTASFTAALFGLFAYVFLYTVLAKRGSAWGTLVGSISGAMPPVVGYVAITNNFDTASLILFLMLVFWQMPHAYAIAIYRLKDYAAAGIPVLPIARGIMRTKIEMLIYVVLFTITSVHLTRIGATGQIYGLIASVASLAWLSLAIYGFYTHDQTKWGRRMFFASLIILMLLFTVMAADTVRVL